jgi:hypothetical protein|tara:strand:- start:480 stop:683 length:204 start_codon:yes stop_codon:yes gene_type:complete
MLQKLVSLLKPSAYTQSFPNKINVGGQMLSNVIELLPESSDDGPENGMLTENNNLLKTENNNYLIWE